MPVNFFYSLRHRDRTLSNFILAPGLRIICVHYEFHSYSPKKKNLKLSLSTAFNIECKASKVISQAQKLLISITIIWKSPLRFLSQTMLKPMNDHLELFWEKYYRKSQTVLFWSNISLINFNLAPISYINFCNNLSTYFDYHAVISLN